MFAICVEFECMEGKRKSFVEKMKESGILDAILAEDGCLRYEYCASLSHPNRLVLMEEWETKEHQQIHLTQPHMKEMMGFKDRFIAATQIKEVLA